MAKFSPGRRALLKMPVALPAAMASTADGQAPARSQARKFFNPAEIELAGELAEAIIPADAHSGGAKAAGVAAYIESVLRDTVEDGQKELWREGLRLVDGMSRRHCGKPFVKAGAGERTAVLEVLSANTGMTTMPEVRFFLDLKRLTVEGYYTSKIGIHDELRYKGNRVLKEFVGCNED